MEVAYRYHVVDDCGWHPGPLWREALSLLMAECTILAQIWKLTRDTAPIAMGIMAAYIGVDVPCQLKLEYLVASLFTRHSLGHTCLLALAGHSSTPASSSNGVRK